MIPEQIPTSIIQQLTAQQAWHYHSLPIAQDHESLTLLVGKENYRADLKEELETLLGKTILLNQIETKILQPQIAKYYRKKDNKRTSSFSMAANGSQNKDFMRLLMLEAMNLGCSDIHFESYEDKCRIRFRIDGLLIERYVLKKEEYPSLVNKIKIKARLDIAEKRLPQDGRIFMLLDGKEKLDLRVSSLPTLHGEKVVLRLLRTQATSLGLKDLGFNPSDLEIYMEGIKKPNGMILISGPTGSGKTTTLYTTLRLLNQTTRNILTIEDPIEYTLEGINQVQLKERIGLDFPSAMRTFLRQDPDIIMVGEIRDQATGSMAIRASLTGHLVLSTIHTNSAWGIVARLIDMGVPAYLLADTLNTVVAQRLVRLLCNSCKEKAKFTRINLPKRFAPENIPKTHYTAKGCDDCFFTGYQGRVAIYEVIEIDEVLADMIKQQILKVKDLLKERGFQSLADNAFQLVMEGKTSIEEVYAILASN